jgi:hypothetical protein
MSASEYDTHREGFGLRRVDLYVFIVLWDIAHAVFLQLLASKEPPCDGVQAQ